MKSKFALTNGIIFTGNNTYTYKALLIEGESILCVVDETNIPESFEKIDVQGKYIAPGLIDLQIYGAAGSLFSADLTVDSINRIEQALLREGCTSFYLTLATNTLEVFKEAIEIYKSTSSEIALGLHLEGPFLNPIKRGAHPEELIIEASESIMEYLLAEDEGVVKMMTIAPELMSPECIQYLQRKGILISAGHSNATYEEANEAFESGVKTVTHLWNAMSPLHHRNVGLPGATYNHHSVHASIIADGIHVDFEAVKISKAMMGERLFLITDAVTSCDKGIYKHIYNKDHYVLPNGTLSGSAVSMIKSVENCVRHIGIALDEAIRMATLYPANLINRDDLGRLEEGALANILVFDDAFRVDSVYFKGQKVDK
ncbi:MAG: N-acetylglucosamine-6-phosphate deacetylase [Sphingobacterium composti]